MADDLPKLVNHAMASNTYNPGDYFSPVQTTTTIAGNWRHQERLHDQGMLQNLGSLLAGQFDNQYPSNLTTEKQMAAITKSNRRVVQVFIVDPDERVPLDKSLLHHSEPKLTDLTDQELFYEIEIKKILDTHNEARIKILDKRASERAGKDINMEPIRIRDLVMTIVDVAKF